jgi:hypothetical protein
MKAVRLDNFGAPVAELVRIGLTPEQVADPALDRLAIEVKPSDSRAQKYIEQFGNRCWEADVLPSEVIRQARSMTISRHGLTPRPGSGARPRLNARASC